MSEEFEKWLQSNYTALIINQSYHIDSFTIHDMNNCWDACAQQQAEIISKQAEDIEKYKKGYDRYETARLMNVRMWGDAYELNIKTGKPFDQIIDELKPFFKP